MTSWADTSRDSHATRLTRMHSPPILMHMRTTLILDDELIAKARGITGLEEKTALVHEGLRALIARESARRLAALGGSERSLRAARRRRRRRPARARRPR
jgi:Arc/MetJ family transcription regulator